MVSLFDLDAFRRPPTDLHERGTIGGSILTILSLVGLVALFVGHVVLFVSVPTKGTEMVVKQFRNPQVQVQLVFDIAMPCPLVDLEVHDMVGKHTVDASRNMTKHRMKHPGKKQDQEEFTLADGDILSVPVQHSQQHDKRDSGKGVHAAYFETDGHDQLDSLGEGWAKAVGAMATAGEWCSFNGTVVIAKLPGRIFVRAHFAQLQEKLGEPQVPESWYNTSHIVRKVTFLDTHVMPKPSTWEHALLYDDRTAAIHPLAAMMPFFFLPSRTPIDLTHKAMTVARTNWRYDLQVVEQISATRETSYDFTMGHYSYQLPTLTPKDGEAEPVSMSYSFSPITVVHTETYQSWWDFARSLLATLGGCFAVLKLLDNTIFLGRSAVVKRQMGKLT